MHATHATILNTQSKSIHVNISYRKHDTSYRKQGTLFMYILPNKRERKVNRSWNKVHDNNNNNS